MNRKTRFGIIFLTVFLMLFLMLIPKVFADSEIGWRVIDGKKYYYYDQYNYYRNTRTYIDDQLYAFDKDGVLVTGWYPETHYYEGEDGKKETHTTWYYFDPETGAACKGSKQIKGTWYYFSEYGEMFANESINIDGKVYFYGASGAWVAKPGWHKAAGYYSNDDAWWYIEGNGACATGWKQIGSTWYYFDPYNGVMADYPTLIPYMGNENDLRIYCFDKSGRWIENPGNWFKYVYKYEKASHTYWFYFGGTPYAKTGWQTIGGTTYYFDEDYGVMRDRPTRIGEEEESSEIYCFANSGAYIPNANGWYSYSDTMPDGEKYTTWYYFENGKAVTGLKTIKGVTYYFDSYDGAMATGRTYIEDEGYTTCYFNEETGAMETNVWHSDGYSYYDLEGNKIEYIYWVYYGEDGREATPTGWVNTIDGVNWYYFSEYGYMYSDGAFEIGDDVYVFDKAGRMVRNRWYSNTRIVWINMEETEETVWYYVTASGKAATGWEKIGGQWYFFNEHGEMAADEIIERSASNWRDPAPEWDESLTWEENELLRDYYGFGTNGVMLANTWFEDTWIWMDYETGQTETGSQWYYFGADGKALRNTWQQSGKNWYFFDVDGIMLSDTILYRSNTDWTQPEPEWDESLSWEENSSRIAVYGFAKSGAMIRNSWYEDKWSWTDYETGEEHSGSEWYYFGADGKAIKGWKQFGKTWYYFDEQGMMFADRVLERSASDWAKPAPEWDETLSWEDNALRRDVYAFSKSGAMITNDWFNEVGFCEEWNGSEWEEHPFSYWYYLQPSGKALKKAWKQGSTGLWYYFKEDSRMVTNDIAEVNGKTYAFNANGAMITNSWFTRTSSYYDESLGEQVEREDKYYLGASGAALKGLQKIGDKYYYFDEHRGEMRTNMAYFDEATHKNYVFGENGEQLFNSWFEDVYVDPETHATTTNYCFVGADGDFVTGWQVIDDKTYYFDEWNHGRVTGIQEIGGKTYEFGEDGVLIGEVIMEMKQSPVADVENSEEETVVEEVKTEETVEE